MTVKTVMTAEERVEKLITGVCSHRWVLLKRWDCRFCVIEMIREAVEAEREACARICENNQYKGSSDVPVTIKAANQALRDATQAIRARKASHE